MQEMCRRPVFYRKDWQNKDLWMTGRCRCPAGKGCGGASCQDGRAYCTGCGANGGLTPPLASTGAEGRGEDGPPPWPGAQGFGCGAGSFSTPGPSLPPLPSFLSSSAATLRMTWKPNVSFLTPWNGSK